MKTVNRYERSMPNAYQRLVKGKQQIPPIGKWNTSDNELGERLKQHFYIEYERTESYTRVRYQGNRCLCSTGGLSDDGERFLAMHQIDGEIQKADCCGRCRRILNNLA